MKIQQKAVTFECDKHGAQKCQIINFGKDWGKAFCSVCKKESREKQQKNEDDRNNMVKIQAKKQQILDLVKQSTIPVRFKHAGFHNYIAKTESQQKNKAFCLEYAGDFKRRLEGATCLIFCGNMGTGKTHLSAAICSMIIAEHQLSAVFMGVIRAVRGVKETFSPQSMVTQQEAINRLIRPDLLVLDEVGVQLGTETEKLILFEILNERYQNVKPTILISNLESSELEKYVGARIVDRFKQNGGAILKFNWESHRGENDT